jgi:hypothetical protein
VTIGARLGRLLSAAGAPLGPPLRRRAGLPAELAELLRSANGFFAFESALHVLPSAPSPAGTMTLQLWNDHDLWRSAYGFRADGLTFFAQDVFGWQFALNEDGVVTFDPEIGEVVPLADTLEGWADQVLKGYDLLTGYQLAHAWQVRNGPLPANARLLPKRPFVLGGAYTVDNLYAVDAVEGMRLRGHLAREIKDLPDGSSVRFTIVG